MQHGIHPLSHQIVVRFGPTPLKTKPTNACPGDYTADRGVNQRWQSIPVKIRANGLKYLDESLHDVVINGNHCSKVFQDNINANTWKLGNNAGTII